MARLSCRATSPTKSLAIPSSRSDWRSSSPSALAKARRSPAPIRQTMKPRLPIRLGSKPASQPAAEPLRVAAVGLGNQLHPVAVRIVEIDAAAAPVMIDLALAAAIVVGEIGG